MVVKFLLHKLINFVFPPQCYICKKIIENEDGLCFDCLSKISFITKPKCECCGIPFEFRLTNSNNKMLCPKCLKHFYKFDGAVSAVRYDEFSKKIILPFKHGDKTHFSKLIAKLMLTAGKSLIEKSDIIIPVPIHLTRMLKRKYNQSSLIAKIIAKQYDKDILYTTLLRKKPTVSQGHLSLKERKQNVSNAFFIKKNNKIKNKNILLIDDVFTSGATVNECVKVLKKNGASKVYVLTFARVVK